MPSLHTASELSGLGEIILCSPMPEPLIYTTSANTVYLKGLWWGFNASKAVKVSSQLGIRQRDPMCYMNQSSRRDHRVLAEVAAPEIQLPH